jgi:hypothetical protein
MVDENRADRDRHARRDRDRCANDAPTPENVTVLGDAEI